MTGAREPEQTGTTTGQPPASAGTGDPEEVRQEIEATRQELGDTIEALAEKTDVKAQARHKIDATKATVADKKDELLGEAKEVSPDKAASAAGQATEKVRQNPLPLALIGAFALGFLLGRLSARDD